MNDVGKTIGCLIEKCLRWLYVTRRKNMVYRVFVSTIIFLGVIAWICIYLSNRMLIKEQQLSSGEKQIVSLFSKLYLESDEKSIVIIDEPELSLSIKWQQMLLPDIMRSQNCEFLLTVTHSPFIFENEFDMDAREIRAYMAKQ